MYNETHIDKSCHIESSTLPIQNAKASFSYPTDT